MASAVACDSVTSNKSKRIILKRIEKEVNNEKSDAFDKQRQAQWQANTNKTLSRSMMRAQVQTYDRGTLSLSPESSALRAI